MFRRAILIIAVFLFAVSSTTATAQKLKRKRHKIEQKHRKHPRKHVSSVSIVASNPAAETSIKPASPIAALPACLRGGIQVSASGIHLNFGSMSPGGTIDVGYLIFNLDSTDCPASTVQMAHILPSGWSETPIADQTILPGEYVIVETTLTGSINDEEGDRQIPFVVHNASTGEDAWDWASVTVDATPPTPYLLLEDAATALILDPKILPEMGMINIYTGATNEPISATRLLIDGVDVTASMPGIGYFAWLIDSSFSGGAHTIVSTVTDLAGHTATTSEVVCYPVNTDGSPVDCVKVLTPPVVGGDGGDGGSIDGNGDTPPRLRNPKV